MENKTNNIEFFKTTDKVVVPSYPYGRLRTQATFSLEWKRGKGFREVFQTINPKNGRVNAPKKSTYSPVLILRRNNDTGFVTTTGCDFNGTSAINKGCEFMNEHFDLFTTEQIEDIFIHLAVMMKADSYAICAYKNVDFAKLKPFIESSVNSVMAGIKSKGLLNMFSQIKLDEEGIKGLEDKNFSPFVTSEPVSLMGLRG